MKTTIKIEIIGHNYYQRSNKKNISALIHSIDVLRITNSHFIAKIVKNKSKVSIKKIYLKGKKDYTDSNSTGSRGIYEWFILECGCVYEIKKPVTWKHTDMFFCYVTGDGNIQKIEEDEIWDLIK